MKKFLLTLNLFALCISVANSQIPNFTPTNGMNAFWPFNNNANDASVNGRNGTAINVSAIADRNGTANNAYSFTANSSSVSVPWIDLSQNMTISFWIKASSNATELTFFNNSWDLYPYIYQSIVVGGNSISFRADPTGAGAAFVIVSDVIDNTWHQVVFTYANNNTLKAY